MQSAITLTKNFIPKRMWKAQSIGKDASIICKQHTGQHILTAAFVRLFGFQTVSFHLGKGLVSIDLDAEEVTEDQLEAAEKLANDVILENRPIETKWVTEEELAEFSLRKPLAVNDDIRIVIIPDFDNNGCGGTHPSSTGQIGLLKILSTEKQKQKVRVHFACGGRVLQQLHRKHKEYLLLPNCSVLLNMVLVRLSNEY